MFEAIYDGRYKQTLLMTARQVGKSTSLANFIIAESISIPFFKSYYVSPSREQTLIFSNTRVGKTLAYSPLVNKYFQSPEHADRVLHRSYTNGAENGFTYACEDADRARGFSADRCLYDEFQEMLFDAVVPVINQCMGNSNYKFETYVGTPKTMEAAIQMQWDRSTQSEWVMKCSGCSKYSFVASEKSIGKHGPICLNCGKVLDPRTGVWIDMVKPTEGKSLIKGFHISQPIMPANVPLCCPGKEDLAQARWDSILQAMDVYSVSKFRNEVLGVSDSVGQRLITLSELQKLCTGPALSPKPSKNIEGVSYTIAGVDWSGGGTQGTSRTVLWIWGFVPSEQRLRCLYYKIFAGTNPVQDVDEISKTLQNYSVAMVVGDAGEGALPNAMLRDRLGHHRVTMAQYGSSTSSAVKWNGVDRYQVDRTAAIDNFMMYLKKGSAIYAPFSEMEPAIRDVLNEYEEVSASGRKVWRHSPQLPDDCLHAQIFGWFAHKIVTGDLHMYFQSS